MSRATAALLCLAASSLLALAACVESPTPASETAYDTEILSRYPAAARVVALGDIHGDINAMRHALWLGEVMDGDGNWIGGETVVVQTGDVLDRGDDEQAIIDELKNLQAQAKEAGGAVHLLQGNHELMNVALDFRYVTDAGFADFEDAPGVDADDPLVARFEPHERARASAFMPGGSYAARLATHPVAIVVGDTAFAHGGVLPRYAANIDRINREVAEWLLGYSDDGERIVEDDDSPVWSRHYSDDPSSRDCRLLADSLEILGVSRMVVGHTVQSNISSACDDRVWRVDVGMSAHYGGVVELLELSDDEVYVLY
jgi:hypothetical protein